MTPRGDASLRLRSGEPCLTTHNANTVLGDHPAARDAAAADLGVAPGAVVALHRVGHYKGALWLLAPSPDAPPSHVLKLDPARAGWSAAREFEGLSVVAATLQGAPGLGALHPVAWGEDPAFVLTRYVAGRSGRPPFDRAIRRPFPGASLGEAERLAREAGRWLRAVRTAGFRPEGGLAPDACLASCRERAGELATHAPRAPAARALRCVEALLGELDAAGRRHLAGCAPTHGDLAPQNLHVGDDGRLYVLDLEGFAMRPLHIDLARFRMRLEHYALGGPLARRRAGRLWRAFVGAQDAGESTGLLGYLHWLLAHSAWTVLPPDRAKGRVARGRRTRLRDALWLRSRWRWLGRLPERPAEARAHFERRL